MRVSGIFLLALCSILVAQNRPKANPKVDQAKIDKAIDEGVKYLRTLGNLDGGSLIAVRNHPPCSSKYAYYSLVALTLTHAGLRGDDNDLKRIVEQMIKEELAFTYSVAIQAMALQKIDPDKYQWRIAQCAQFLVDNQCENGQWCYGNPVNLDHLPPPKETFETEGTKKPSRRTAPQIPVKKRKKGPPSGDNSNSQYATLGLRACYDSGIIIPKEVLTQAKKAWEDGQGTDGGWGYTGPEGQAKTIPGQGQAPASSSEPSYGSMTAGGISAYCIIKYLLRQDYKNDARIKKAVKWLANNFDIKANPKMTAERAGSTHHYYWLYALERAGILYGTETFGSHEWYPEGVNYLLQAQGSDGSWNNNIVDTCFAILFLRRSTRPLMVETKK